MPAELALPTGHAWPLRPGAATTLQRCLLLAALLHALLVMWVGSVPAGSARSGDGVWGALNVVLQGPAHTATGAAADGRNGQTDATAATTAAQAARTAAAALPAYTGPQGTAPQQRWGGLPRDTAAAELTQTGAAQIGTWNAVATERLAGPNETERPTQPVLQPDPLPKPPATFAAERANTPERVVPAAPEPPVIRTAPEPPVIRTAPAVIAAPVPVPAAPAAPPRPDPPGPPAAQPLPDPPAPPAPPAPPSPTTPLRAVAPRALAATSVTPAAIEPVATPSLAPPALPPVALPPAPVVKAAALPKPEIDALPAPLPLPLPAQATDQATVPALPIRLAAPVEPPPMPAITAAPAVPPAAVPAAVPAVAPAVAPAATPAATHAATQVAPATPPATPSPALPPVPTTAANTPSPTPTPTPTPAATVTPASAAPGVASAAATGLGAAPRADTPRLGAGAPDAGARLGRDVATPPTAASSAPRLNLDLPGARSGQLSSQGARGVLQLLPRPPEGKSKLAESIEKAAKEDCRKAYAGMGLLAVLPLAADAVRDKGCKW